MRRLSAHAAEVVRRGDNAAAKVIVPNSIHNRPPNQRVIRSGQPFCQLRAPLALRQIGRKFPVDGGGQPQHARIRRLTLLLDVARDARRGWGAVYPPSV